MKLPTWPLLTLLLAGAATAISLEKTAHELEGKLMAPCCWTQTVSKHYSGAAGEIRQGIRTMLSEGKNRQEILDFYVATYGERILAMPPARGFNLMAYLLPGLFLVVGGWTTTALLRKWRQDRSPDVFDTSHPPPERAYAERLERELQKRE